MMLHYQCCDSSSSFLFAVGQPTLDLEKMMAQKLDAVKGLTSGIAYLFKNNKVGVCCNNMYDGDKFFDHILFQLKHVYIWMISINCELFQNAMGMRR